MQNDTPAISLSRDLHAWRWELINDDGQTIEMGSAGSQEAALQCAWQAARVVEAPKMNSARRMAAD
jgi:hypothetical protein